MESAARVPEWDLADRMRKALREADLGVTEMAEYLDVNRNTVGTWINGRIVPSTQTMRLWALRCGVPYEWLVSGDGGDAGRSRRDLNPRPSPWKGTHEASVTCELAACAPCTNVPAFPSVRKFVYQSDAA